MTLPGLAFPLMLDTSAADLIRDFFVPALSVSARYDRGVGYFSSGWIKMSATGMLKFAENGGRARWVTSPILDKADWEALQAGEAARSDPTLHAALDAALERNISNLADVLEQETLSGLAWMVADEIITFRIALPYNKLEQGDFHDKFGIFTDNEGNQLSFNGSYNDSIQGTRNYESIKLFSSWQSILQQFVQGDIDRFERLWNNEDPNVRVFDLSEAAHERILRLRTNKRPYPEPGWIKALAQQLRPSQPSPPKPSVPAHVVLREYQSEAIKAWFDNDRRGLLEMATGTGKTITALAAAVEVYRREPKLLVVIACPYTHLVKQWADIVEEFGFNNVLAFSSAGPWADKTVNQLLNISAGHTDNLVVLTTHDTFSSESFRRVIEQHPLPTMLIVDEVHDVGSAKRRTGLLAQYPFRLGLSATPRRWLDEEGTDVIFDYFDRTVFEFPLAKAIPEFLTPYEYHPFFVELTEEEFEAYQVKTRQILRRMGMRQNREQDDILNLYMILRQQIIVNAEHKYQCFESIVGSLKNRRHTLVYCSPEQINRAQAILNIHGIIQSRFTNEESLTERTTLLNSFAAGHHEMLVAMNCLDQGVDVPSTRNAIFLASSGNPKQFIQRRGRVLRKATGKDKAVIFDIIVVPTLHKELDADTRKLESRILRKELQRYDEFAELALNRAHALNVIGPIRRKYLLD